MPEAKLLPNQLKEAAYHRTEFAATPAVGTTLEDVTNNEYWTHVARKLKPGSIIEVLPEDMTFFAELLVLWVGQAAVRVKVLRHIPLTEDDIAEVEGSAYKTTWRPNKNWCVVRKADNIAIKDGLPSKKDAAMWLADFEIGGMTS